MMSAEIPLLSTRHQVITTKKTPTNQRHKKGTGISRKLRNLLGVLSFNMEAYFCISASSSLVESDKDNWIILR